MAAYGSPKYWDDRYQSDPEPFDWYQRYDHLKSKLEVWVSRSDYILNVGCGNSTLTEDMYADEYTSIANVDVSKVVIDQMKTRHSDKATLTWSVMDVKQRLEFNDGTFDVVLDKGTLDSILCGESSTNSITNSIYEILRVLKADGGRFVMISHWGPDKWAPYLEGQRYGWDVTYHQLDKPSILMVPAGGGMDERDGASNAEMPLRAVSSGGAPMPIPSGRVQGYHYLYLCKRKAAFY